MKRDESEGWMLKKREKGRRKREEERGRKNNDQEKIIKGLMVYVCGNGVVLFCVMLCCVVL